jgi:hypothetical protein
MSEPMAVSRVQLGAVEETAVGLCRFKGSREDGLGAVNVGLLNTGHFTANHLTTSQQSSIQATPFCSCCTEMESIRVRVDQFLVADGA